MDEKYLEELRLNQEKFILYCDDQSTICLNKNLIFHLRFKHINIRYHWIRDILERKVS